MNERPDPPYAFGQVVFSAVAYNHNLVSVPCPICFGKLFVTLILGNGEQQAIQCDACGHGYESPRGVVGEYRAESRVEEGVITGMSWDSYHEKWCVTVNGHARDNLFTSLEEAEAARARMHAEQEESARKNWEEQLDNKKRRHTWSAHYHRSCLADLERRAKHHRDRLADPRIRERKEKEGA